jgi:dihydroflavonol-4-reductase
MPSSDVPICVTGATGFVASEIVAQLLADGYKVTGTTRDPERAWQEGHVTGVPGATDRLELIAADLMRPGAFDDVVNGSQYVIHTASPYETDVEDPQRDLIDPAVQGTLNVLRAAAKSPTVKRVVLTSSFAAITDEPDGSLLDESDWNTKSTLKRNAYYLSKAEAERAAWRFMEEQQPAFDLVAINPPFILGPSRIPQLNTSPRVIAGMTNGLWPGIVDIQWVIVDVRDVALAHIRAIETESASGRYLTGAGIRSMRQVVDLLRENGWAEKYRLPSISLDNGFGTFLVGLVANLQKPGSRSYLKTHVGGEFRIDNAKVRRELGIEFRDIDQTILDTMSDLEKWGHLGK